jgi:hypothetical protein
MHENSGKRSSCSFWRVMNFTVTHTQNFGSKLRVREPTGKLYSLGKFWRTRDCQRRQSQRLFCRRHPGRDSDPLIEDRRSEGYFPDTRGTTMAKSGTVAGNLDRVRAGRSFQFATCAVWHYEPRQTAVHFVFFPLSVAISASRKGWRKS